MVRLLPPLAKRPLARLATACTGLGIALAQAACGPVGATSLVGDAEIAVTRAHAADGDRHALYEVTSADLYLEKAKEEQGHAHYGAAMELAKKSAEMAQAATLKAGQVRTGQAPLAPAPSTLTRPDPLPAPGPSRPLVTEPPALAPTQRATAAPVQPAPRPPTNAPAAVPAPAPVQRAPLPPLVVPPPELPARTAPATSPDAAPKPAPQPAPSKPAAAAPPAVSPALATPAPAADIAVPQLPAAAPLPTVTPGAALPDIPAGQRAVLIPGAAPKSDGKPEDKPKREKQPIQPENAP